MKFAYDSDADALAITLGEGAVVRTVEFDSGTLVDVDENDGIVTIEVIRPARRWPLDEIDATFAIGPDDLRVLRHMFGGSRSTYAFTRPAHVASDDRDLELVGT